MCESKIKEVVVLNHPRRKTRIRVISLLLSVMLLADGIAPAAAMLTDAPGVSQLTMIDSEGQQIAVDESWEETFPYGTFAFASGQLELKEGEGA